MKEGTEASESQVNNLRMRPSKKKNPRRPHLQSKRRGVPLSLIKRKRAHQSCHSLSKGGAQKFTSRVSYIGEIKGEPAAP